MKTLKEATKAILECGCSEINDEDNNEIEHSDENKDVEYEVTKIKSHDENQPDRIKVDFKQKIKEIARMINGKSMV